MEKEICLLEALKFNSYQGRIKEGQVQGWGYYRMEHEGQEQVKASSGGEESPYSGEMESQEGRGGGI